MRQLAAREAGASPRAAPPREVDRPRVVAASLVAAPREADRPRAEAASERAAVPQVVDARVAQQVATWRAVWGVVAQPEEGAAAS